jgi:hypothetical protein
MPSDTDVTRNKINRGMRAKHLLDDAVLMEAFDALLDDADKSRESSAPHDVDLREECHRAKKSIEALRKKLAFWVADGSMEQARLDEEEKRSEALNGK